MFVKKIPLFSSEEFQCIKLNGCISISYVCDGERDCQDGSDEDPEGVCKLSQCKNDEFK